MRAVCLLIIIPILSKSKCNIYSINVSFCRLRNARNETCRDHVRFNILFGFACCSWLRRIVFRLDLYHFSVWNNWDIANNIKATTEQVISQSLYMQFIHLIKQTKITLFVYRFRYALAFLTPALPFIPAIAITVNIYLIFKLSILTLVRFTVWMTLGLVMYFYYGITHSSLENAQEEIELTVDQSYLTPNVQQKSNSNHHSQTPTAVWDRHGYENKMAEDSWSTSAAGANNYATNSWDIGDTARAWDQPASNIPPKPTIPSKPAAPSSSKGRPAPPSRPAAKPKTTEQQPSGGFTSIFVDETQFPTWDD